MSLLLFWYGGLGFAVPRIVLAILLIVHGWPKVRNLKTNAGNFSGMGFRPGWLWGTIAALVEFAGGILFVLGMWVPYLCLLLMGEFAVIIVWKWIKRMHFVGGWELDTLILMMALMIFTLYGGFFLFPFNGI